jgi:hypothetical protein
MLDADEILAGARTTVTFDPRDMVRELIAFGEANAAERIVQLPAGAIAAIGVLASRHLSSADRPFLDKAICLGVVEFIEGKSRPLSRKRRLYPRDAASSR